MSIGEGLPVSHEDDPQAGFTAFKETVIKFLLTRGPSGYAHVAAFDQASARTGLQYTAPSTHYIRVQKVFHTTAAGGPRPVPQVILHAWDKVPGYPGRQLPPVYDAQPEFHAQRILLAEASGRVWFIDADERLATTHETGNGWVTEYELVDWTHGGDDGSSGDREPREPFAPIGHLSLEQEF